MKLSDLDIHAIGTTIQMAGMVYASGDQTFILPLPDERDCVSKPLVFLDMNQTDWQTFLQQTDHVNVEVEGKDKDGNLVKLIRRKSQRQIDQNTSWQVYRRDGMRCRWCGDDKVPLTVDHLVQWEQGGPSIPDNLVSSCRNCNKTRGKLSVADWLRHPHYLKSQRALIGHVVQLNAEIPGRLHLIPRQWAQP